MVEKCDCRISCLLLVPNCVNGAIGKSLEMLLLTYKRNASNFEWRHPMAVKKRARKKASKKKRMTTAVKKKAAKKKAQRKAKKKIHKVLAPFVPTPQEVVDRMLELER